MVTVLPLAGLKVYVWRPDQVGERRTVGAALHAQRLRAGAPTGGRQLQHDLVDALRRAEIDLDPLREGVVDALPVAARVAVDDLRRVVDVGVAALLGGAALGEVGGRRGEAGARRGRRVGGAGGTGRVREGGGPCRGDQRGRGCRRHHPEQIRSSHHCPCRRGTAAAAACTVQRGRRSGRSGGWGCGGGNTRRPSTGPPGGPLNLPRACAEIVHVFVKILRYFDQRLLTCYGSVNTSTTVTIDGHACPAAVAASLWRAPVGTTGDAGDVVRTTHRHQSSQRVGLTARARRCANDQAVGAARHEGLQLLAAVPVGAPAHVGHAEPPADRHRRLVARRHDRVDLPGAGGELPRHRRRGPPRWRSRDPTSPGAGASPPRCRRSGCDSSRPGSGLSNTVPATSPVSRTSIAQVPYRPPSAACRSCQMRSRSTACAGSVSGRPGAAPNQRVISGRE